MAYRGGELVGRSSILGKLGEGACQDLINFALGHMATLKLPAKRGTFVEFRSVDRRMFININDGGGGCRG